MKVITSPSTIWKGSVVLADPLTMPQVREIDIAMSTILDADRMDKADQKRIYKSIVDGESKIFLSATDEVMLPAILACVTEWKLENFPETVTLETFPMSPRPESHKLIDWLFKEVQKVYNGEMSIPNE